MAVFPSDQFILEADHLMRHIIGPAVVERQPSKLVMLGVAPDYEESDYGYILPRPTHDISGWGIYECFRLYREAGYSARSPANQARRFVEHHAHGLQGRHSVALGKRTPPRNLSTVCAIYDAIGTDAEGQAVHTVYRQLTPVNFSKELLEPLVEQHPGN